MHTVWVEMRASSGEPEDWLEECLDAVPAPGSGPPGPGPKCEALTCSQPPATEPHQVDQKENRIPSKPHSTPMTLKWLEETYEIAEGVCIPRSTLYLHYLDFCEKNDSQPVNAASFGKIIRQQFPHLTTRRLGTRGQSKYHYYGIGVKETSPYYDVTYSRKGAQSLGDGKKDPVKQIVAYSPRSKLGTLLPEFPSVKDLELPSNVTSDNVNTFLMMYRTHCQRILDTVIRANFDEVQSFLLHFWQGMPQHIVPMLGTPLIVSLVGVCDSILYKAISGVLMPTVLQALPDSLTQVIRKFARQLDDWLRIALEELPEALQQTKLDLARRFAQVLKRQTSLNHLCQASRTVLQSADITGQMLEDWHHVDLGSIVKQTLYTMDQYQEHDHHLIVSLYREFEVLLQEQAPLEAYTEWLDSMVDRCVITPATKKPGSLRRLARQFLLMWSCFGTRVIRDMTLHSAPSFGSFHLLHLMFDDYVLYLVESLHSTERARDLLKAIKGQNVSDPSDLVLPNPSFTNGSSLFTASVANGNNGASMDTPVADRQSVITDGREAFGSCASFSATSPSVPSSQASGSPTYEMRSDVESCQQVSPCSDARGTGHTTSALTTSGSCSSSHYSSRYDMASTLATTDGTASYAYSYGYANPQVQYSYGTRDYSCLRASSDWPEQRYVTNTSASTDAHIADYSGYNCSRETGYDVTAYQYDPTAFPAAMRSHSTTSQGAIYYNYGVQDTGSTSQYESSTTSPEVGGRKRKSTSGVEESSSFSKKSLQQGDFEYGTNGSAYQRA